MHIHQLLLGLCLSIETFASATLLSEPGEVTVIPSWDIQSTEKVGADLEALSQAGVDTKTWHAVNSSRCTLMGCLINAGVYREDGLFFSNALQSFNSSQFKVPWIYRKEFALTPEPGQHYHLQTHGISSSADIYINGQEVVARKSQAGAYVGNIFDITDKVKEANAVAIQVHPTDYNYDFALGFVDWNPYPPDNGTGVWRDVEVKQTGPIALGPLRVATQANLPIGHSSALVTLKATVTNLEDREYTVLIAGSISLEGGASESYDFNQTVTVSPRQSVEVALDTAINEPAIWWPKQWGAQPLYIGQLSATVDDAVSDKVERNFGIRKVTADLNANNDTLFFVNGYPFQVVGAGYSADIFLRWDSAKFSTQAKMMLDLGHNTVRLEGKNEHPELYDIADRLGIMVLPGWECCDKWEAWKYNEDLAVKSEWTDADYIIANKSMSHEALMQQGHPSVLGYLVGSDYWPDDKAAEMYYYSLKAADWQMPIVASASERGYPKILGPSGLKMAGPYDWVPPNYWYDVDPAEDRLGAAFGFGSELGAGVGTPEMGSLKKFLSDSDLEDLWKKPNKGLYHMSTSVSSFYDRKIYNAALWKRLGVPSSLEDYLLKAQILDYEATRSQFEGFAALWNAERPATGLIYWMLNNAWPSLHWNLFDYYLRPAGSYFGAKVGARKEHVAYDYNGKLVYLINRSLDQDGPRTISAQVIDKNGKEIYKTQKVIQTEPNTSKEILDLSDALEAITDVVFLRLVLSDGEAAVLSRNVYWLAKTVDTLDWDNSDWFYTPVTQYANFTALNNLPIADVSITLATPAKRDSSKLGQVVVVENHSDVPAFFVTLNLVDKEGNDVLPVFWSDNYVTLWPNEKLELQVEGKGGASVQVAGKNIHKAEAYL
ncbi:glycoside hydrolase family 2 protein [Annulohypoxylon maeteangense]|uniref:glycoside hydrolase family 2 protein n=1 Tax=Annulohypoxylon maeteangense TaxID=1927788 RepID=UPI0020080BE7|nr:glycoside hydrolase family 2 protein [Annulohypoxylon maeteangense]KAI0890665.1 glycoside hydrolase family 2 protein [Annulohypoxylon maeteangense]